MQKTIWITGASSGIGQEFARRYAKLGCRLILTARRTDRLEALAAKLGTPCRILPADLAKEEDCQRLFKELEGETIDIFINNAGFGISGAVEFTETSDAQRLFDVNFFGMVRMNRAILPLMREQGHGRIVNLSSVAAPVPIPFQTYYSAGKAAVNSYTMALSNEVKPFGITVAAVMPGDIKTGFTAARQKNIIGDDIYGGRISRSVAGMEKDEQTGMDPAAAGRFIADVALKNSRKPLYTIGLAYKGAVFLTKILPARWLNGLIGMIYAK